jgi:hypothetical protein
MIYVGDVSSRCRVLKIAGFVGECPTQLCGKFEYVNKRMETVEKKRHKHLIKHSELIGRFDQFCDYTSVVGFRLLKSENPLWIR